MAFSVDVSGNPYQPGVVAFTVPEHKKAVLTAVMVTNENTVHRAVYISDVFTPASSNGTASPVSTRRKRAHLVVGGGPTSKTLTKEELGNVECLGVVDVSTNIADASLNIHLAYDLV